MLEYLGLLSTALAVIGVLLNNRRLIMCFPIWIISNCICAFVHLQSGIYSLFVRDILFIVLAIEGLFRWRKKVEKRH